MLGSPAALQSWSCLFVESSQPQRPVHLCWRATVIMSLRPIHLHPRVMTHVSPGQLSVSSTVAAECVAFHESLPNTILCSYSWLVHVHQFVLISRTKSFSIFQHSAARTGSNFDRVHQLRFQTTCSADTLLPRSCFPHHRESVSALCWSRVSAAIGPHSPSSHRRQKCPYHGRNWLRLTPFHECICSIANSSNVSPNNTLHGSMCSWTKIHHL